MSRPSRTAIRDNDPTYFWKLLLRVLAILFAAVAIGTIAWACTVRYNGDNNTDDDFNDFEGDGDYFYTTFTILLPWVIIALGLSIIWNIINIIILLTRNRWIHPGANVGCDLVLWLTLSITGAVAGVGAGSYLSYGWDYDSGYNDYTDGGDLTYPNGTVYYVPTLNATDCGDISCGNNNYPSPHVGIVVIVGCAFAYIVMLFHFALFISACRYTHSLRHSKYSAKHTLAVTEEATQIARRMIAEMTGPNGAFIPLNNQQQQPLLQPSQNRSESDIEMQRQPDNNHQQPTHQQPTHQQPIQQQQQQPQPQIYEPSAPNATQRWAAGALQPPPQVSVDSPMSETSNVAERWAVPLPEVNNPSHVAEEGNTHPALRRRGDDGISPV